MSAQMHLSIDVEHLKVPVLLFEVKSGKINIIDQNQESINLINEEKINKILEAYFNSYENIKKEKLFYEHNNLTFELHIEKQEDYYVLIFQDISAEKLLKYRLGKTQLIAKLGDWENDLVNKKEFWSKEIYELLDIDEKYQRPNSELFSEFIHPDDSERVINLNKSSISDSREYEVEFRIITKSGNVKWMFTRGTKEFDENGKISKIFGTMQDITAYKKLESELLEEKKKFEMASQTKSIFLANMSHEIRTPLNGIVGMTNILRHEIENPNLQLYINNIKYSSDYLLQVIGDVLDFSKIESGKMIIEKKIFDFKIMMSNLEYMFKQRCNEKNLLFEIEFDSNIPYKLMGDYVRLQQVLINLIGNAIKFTQIGEVKLAVKISKIYEKTIFLNFEVSDTGIGIPKNRQENIFNIYDQGTIDSRYGGTGLGLPISKKILEAMSGKLSVQSILGRGSIFTFNLEFELADENILIEEVGVEKYDIDQQYCLKLIVAEDDSISRLYIEKLLSGILKHKLILAKDGEELIDLYKKNKVDAILVDSKMPKKNGNEAIKEIRKYEIEKGIHPVKIIAMSAGVGKDEIATFKENGANYFVGKPIRETYLVEILNSIKEQLKDFIFDENLNKENFVFNYIDVEGIEQSNKLMGYSKMNMIIKFAIEEYELVVAKIEQCIELQNFDYETLQALHKIKGTIGYFSAIKIAKHLPEIEMIFSNEYDIKEKRKIDEFMDDFKKFISELKIYSEKE